MNQNYLESLNDEGDYTAQFVGRIEGVPVDTDRDATITRLEPFHREVIKNAGFCWDSTWWAEQVHGGEVAVVTGVNGELVKNVDGLISNIPEALLAIYVADCGALYLLDRVKKAIGLLHSGKKGTEAEILRVAIGKMEAEFGTNPADVEVVLAPCIRPPAYDVDFARDIRETATSIGVKSFLDCEICTSSDLTKYYSYRVEKGSTGRMLAIFGIRE